jgi:hypothetical protein
MEMKKYANHKTMNDLVKQELIQMWKSDLDAEK